MARVAFGIIGVVICVIAWILAVVVIGLYAASYDGVNVTCGGVTIKGAQCRERTAGMGLFASTAAFIAALVFIALWLLPMFVEETQGLIGQVALKGTIIVVSIILAISFLCAWALMAKDIDDATSGTGCDAPGAWAAALAFAVLSMIVWVIMGILGVIALIFEGFYSPPPPNQDQVTA
jgi:hypothetical protein